MIFDLTASDIEKDLMDPPFDHYRFIAVAILWAKKSVMKKEIKKLRDKIS